MTTINLTPVEPVEASTTAGDAVVTYPLTAISSYGTWYEQAKLAWEGTLAKDLVTVSAIVAINVSSDATTTGEQSVVEVRFRLFDDTRGHEVWAGVYVSQPYRNFEGVVFGQAKSLTAFNRTFQVDTGMLREGTDYSVRVDVKKTQVVGTPAFSVGVEDISIFADSARIF